MRAAQECALKSLVSHGIKMSLVILIFFAAVGCQSQKKTQENLVLLQQNMDSNTDKMVSLIQKLEENQQNINEDIKSLKASQHNVTTKMMPAQRQLANQVTETTKITRQDQAKLQTTLQTTGVELMQNQCDMQESLVALQQNLDSNAEKTVLLVQRLEDNQRTINEDVESLKTAQHSIITQVVPTQQQLADQMAETTKTIRQDQAKLQRAFQVANAQLLQQVKNINERQQRLEVITETIQENGQGLQVSHDHFLVKLTDLQKTYVYGQKQLDTLKEHIATLDSNVMVVQAGLSQFKDILKEEFRGNLVAQNELIRGAEQTLEQRFTGLNGVLTNVGEVQKTLLILLQDIDKPTKMLDKKTAQASEFSRQKKEQVSASLPSQVSEPQTSNTSVSVPAP